VSGGKHVVRRLASAVVAAGALGCSAQPPDRIPVPGQEGAFKTAAAERAARRAYDGAPPTIPHESFRIDCVACHDQDGMAVAGVGFAPPLPHELTRGMSAMSRCGQCHVFVQAGDEFAANGFAGLRQDLRRGARLYELAPPTIPHETFMRENCLACHAGPAAREEVRTSHPERVRCRQCHAAVETLAEFRPAPQVP
jgi:nitrate reductase cytochrome c-type subunit